MRPSTFYALLVALTLIFGVVVILNPHFNFAPKKYAPPRCPPPSPCPSPKVEVPNGKSKVRASTSSVPPTSTPNPTKSPSPVEVTTLPALMPTIHPPTTPNFEEKANREETKPTTSITPRHGHIVIKTPVTPTVPPLPTIATPPPVKVPIS